MPYQPIKLRYFENTENNQRSNYKVITLSALFFFLSSRFHVTPKEHAGGWVQSISSGENMVVEIKYRDNPDFAKQTVKITYEFLDYDKMMELLKAQNWNFYVTFFLV